MNLREQLKKDFGIDFPISGALGQSKDAPIVIHRVEPNDYTSIEHGILRCLGMDRGITWKLKQQALLDHNGRKLDQIKIETVETTPTEIIRQTENYYFDITECW